MQKKSISIWSVVLYDEKVFCGADWRSGQLVSQREREERLRIKCNG